MIMEKMSGKLKQILDHIRKSQSILITSHRDPDGDSIGSQLALAEFVESQGKSGWIINQGDLPYKYKFLDSQSKIQNVNSTKKELHLKTAFDLVLVLDCTSLDRIGDVEKLIPTKITLVNIDHHPDNDRFGTFNYLDIEASAVGEIIFSLLKLSGFSFTPQVATQLYATILTDTGRFKFSNTSPHCLRICAELIESGADPKQVTNQIYFNHTLPFLKLLGSMLSHPQIILDGKICAMTVNQDLLSQLKVDPSEMEGVVDYSLFLRGVEIGLLFTEKENEKTKVNLRSQNAFDVSQVARIFGGGGHRNAAGCTLNLSLKEAEKIVVEQIEKILKNEPVGSLSS
jgi:bifunctional oligoribonuclease and PAP phosphatase NrnA